MDDTDSMIEWDAARTSLLELAFGTKLLMPLFNLGLALQ